MEELIESDRVTVGVDGSASSVDALRYAARIADAFDAPLEAITTWSYPAFTSWSASAEWSPEEDAKAILTTAVEQAFGGTPPPLRRTIIPGPPAHALIEQSKRSAMLVLGSRGRGGFAGLLLGSVSAACAQHAHCPVLIVHSRDGSGSESDDTV